jgi:hypothetical protein
MTIKMNLAEACEIINEFALANSCDQLRAVELMVQHYLKLNRWERTAIATFMDETKSPRVDKQKIL